MDKHIFKVHAELPLNHYYFCVKVLFSYFNCIQLKFVQKFRTLLASNDNGFLCNFIYLHSPPEDQKGYILRVTWFLWNIDLLIMGMAIKNK